MQHLQRLHPLVARRLLKFVTFTVPSDVAPKPGVYNATLTGVITSGASGATVNWSTTTLTFNSPSVGSFVLTLEPSTPINAPRAAPDAQPHSWDDYSRTCS